jgi:hypothetical protein
VSTFTGVGRIGQVVGCLSARDRRRRSRSAIASWSSEGRRAGRPSSSRQAGMLQPQPSREEMLRDVLAEHLKRPLHAGRHQSRTKSLSETAPHPPSDTDRGFTARPSGRRRADPPGRVVVQTVTMGSRCPQRATLTPWDGRRPRRRRGRGRPQGHRPSAVHRSLVVCTPCWLSNAPAAACC